jgi:hypothetical protein
VKRAVLRLDPRGADEKHKAAAKDRGVWVRPDEDGMAHIHVYTTATDAQCIATAVQARAEAMKADGLDGRTADQRRADALTDLCLRDLNSGKYRAQGRKPAIQVTIAASTLAGLDYQPGELMGYGPIPASLALSVAFDQTGTWRRLVTDDYGQVIDSATKAYRPPADMRGLVMDRDRTCRFIGCNRAAQHSEIDHIQDWAYSHNTSVANLQVVCGRHHHLKHEAGWDVNRRKDGTTIWTDPASRQYEKPPDDIPLDTILNQHTHENPPPKPDPEPPPF